MSILLICGILLFGLAHLFPAACPGAHQTVIGKIGRNPYRGIFALIILAALILIVIGWRSSSVAIVYSPPEWGYLAAQVLMYPALFLFISARANSNIKRIIRHPQLTSVALWGVAHLLANGESRAALLFGGLAVWALGEIFFINRRDGAWRKPAAAPYSADIKVAVIAVAVYAALAFGHGYFTGAPAF